MNARIQKQEKGGGRWTRTTELIRGQIYSLLQLPLCDSPLVQRTQLFSGMRGKNT